MSWKVLNEILGLASIDQEFCQQLLENPTKAIQDKGFSVTSKELRALNSIKAQDISDFSHQLISKLKPDKSSKDTPADS